MLRMLARASWGALIVSLLVSVACGDGGSGSGAASGPYDCPGAPTILVSSYDQTCSNAADCTMVSEGQFCAPECPPCPYAVISVGALTKYGHDVAAASKEETGSFACGVCAPAPFPACCIGGKCHADSQCARPMTADASSPDGG
jgi:hypothetical protein